MTVETAKCTVLLDDFDKPSQTWKSAKNNDKKYPVTG